MLLLIEMVLITKLALAIAAPQQRKEKNDAISPLDLRLQSITSYGLVADAMDCILNEMTTLIGRNMTNKIKQATSLEAIDSRVSFSPALDGNLDVGQKVTGQVLVDPKSVLVSAWFSKKLFSHIIKGINKLGYIAPF